MKWYWNSAGVRYSSFFRGSTREGQRPAAILEISTLFCCLAGSLYFDFSNFFLADFGRLLQLDGGREVPTEGERLRGVASQADPALGLFNVTFWSRDAGLMESYVLCVAKTGFKI